MNGWTLPTSQSLSIVVRSYLRHWVISSCDLIWGCDVMSRGGDGFRDRPSTDRILALKKELLLFFLLSSSRTSPPHDPNDDHLLMILPKLIFWSSERFFSPLITYFRTSWYTCSDSFIPFLSLPPFDSFRAVSHSWWLKSPIEILRRQAYGPDIIFISFTSPRRGQREWQNLHSFLSWHRDILPNPRIYEDVFLHHFAICPFRQRFSLFPCRPSYVTRTMIHTWYMIKGNQIISYDKFRS